MKTIPPVDWNHKPACKEPIRELLVRKPLIERVGPVLADLLWTIQGEKRAGRGGKPLPAYCYNIFKIMRKTYFKILPESERLAPCGSKEQDWDALGKVVGAGLRCLSFGEFDLEGILKGESLPAKERADLLGAISAIPAWLNGNGSDDAPGAPMASRFVKGSDQLWEACLASQQSACRSGCEPLLQLNKAIDKGLRGFVDESGACVGESGRANIYWFLLLVWPEIKEMQEARPRKTRNDFYEWMKPFVECGFVSLQSLGQLVDVSDRIGLKFAERGAPAQGK
jgi:hypothetical protein